MTDDRLLWPADVFVGRGRERAELRAGLEEARSGRARVFLIAGEPGIGKTALCEQVAGQATETGAQVHWGRCWEGEGAPPCWPWTQVIRSWLDGVSREDAIRHLGRGAAPVTQIVPELARLVGDSLPAGLPNHEEARFQLFDAVTALFRSIAPEKPVVLLFEDLHWADRPSLLLLQFLTREIFDAPILVVVTYRDTEVRRGQALSDVLPRLRYERIVTRILLRGLPEREVRELLETLGGETVPAGFVRAVTRETDGNPFFIQELFRHLIDEGLFVRDGDRWVSRLAAGSVPLPESLREVIGRRLERLDPICHEVIRTASVVGREFSLDVLGCVTSHSHEELLEILDPAEATGLVQEVPRSIGRYAFSHGLVRETLIQELRPLERIRIHHAIGEALEVVYGADLEPHLPELAHHFLESVPMGDVSRGLDYALRAARRARAQGGRDEAIELYRQTLDTFELGATTDERLHCEILLELGEALQDASAGLQAGATFRQAADLASRLGDSELFARAALGLAGSVGQPEVHASRTEVQLLEQALERVGEGEITLRAQVMAQLAAALTFSEAQDHKLELAREAIDLARRVGEPRSLAHVLYVTQFPLWNPDNLDDRVSRSRETIRLAVEGGETRLAALAASMRVAHLLEAGDVAAVRKERSERRRVPRDANVGAVMTVTDTMLALLEGRFDDVEAQAGHALASAGGSNAPALLGAYGAQLHFLRREQDRLDEVVDLVRSFLDEFPQVPAWRGGLAWTFAELDRSDEARAELEILAADEFRGIRRDMLWLPVMWQLAETAVLLLDRDRSETLYDLLAPYADRCVTMGLAVCVGSVSRTLGELAMVLGRFDEAHERFLQGLDVDTRLGARPWVAWGQFGLARLFVLRGGPGDRDHAVERVTEAAATARALGMTALGRRLGAWAAEHSLGTDETKRSDRQPARTEGRRGPVLPSVLRREGAWWTIEWAGRSFRLRHTKGLRYLAHLLARPDEEVHALDLLAACGERRLPEEREGDLERLRELRNELAEAEKNRDVARAEHLSETLARLTEELAAARIGPEAERARLAVTKPVKTAIRRIRSADRALGRHLETSIRTGYVCSYSPDPGTPAWTTSV